MPTPAPTSSDTPGPLPAIWDGLVQAAHQHPWSAAVVVLLALSALVRALRVAVHSGPRDPVRCFNRSDKHALLALAGHQCEHHGLLSGRCPSTLRLEADHVHPWSRGGWTNVRNGQILCHSHNRAKSAAIPWDRSLRRLAVRRVAYYSESAARVVIRRARKSERARS